MSARKYAFRKKVLLTLSVLLVLSAVLAAVLSPGAVVGGRLGGRGDRAVPGLSAAVRPASRSSCGAGARSG